VENEGVVTSAWNHHQRLARRRNGIHVVGGELYRGDHVLRALEEEHRHLELRTPARSLVVHGLSHELGPVLRGAGDQLEALAQRIPRGICKIFFQGPLRFAGIVGFDALFPQQP